MSKHAQMQSIHQFFAANSTPARRLLNNGFKISSLRTNAILRRSEWTDIDTAVVGVSRRRLGAIQDLRNAGLVRNLGSLGVLISEYEKLGDMSEAEQSMSGVAPGRRDLPEWQVAAVPIPITFHDFQLNIRTLEASRRNGGSIDTTAAEIAGIKVAEKLEDVLFNGSSVQIAGSVLHGYTTYPDRMTGAFVGNEAWTAAGHTGEEIVADVLAMISDGEALNMFGPWMFYVPVDYNAKLREDFKANSDKTIRQRLLEIDQVAGFRSTSFLTNEVVAVQMERSVVDLAIASDIVVVEWDTMGGFISNFKVFAAMAQRIKSTTDGTTGVIHYAPTEPA